MSQNTPTNTDAPDPEVVPRSKCRQFAAEYKPRILEEANNYTEPGQGGLLPLAVSSQSDPGRAVDPDSGVGR